MLVACQGRGANGDFEVTNRNCRIFEFGELVKSYTFWQVNLNGDNYGMSSDWPNLKFIMKFYYFVRDKKSRRFLAVLWLSNDRLRKTSAK